MCRGTSSFIVFPLIVFFFVDFFFLLILSHGLLMSVVLVCDWSICC